MALPDLLDSETLKACQARVSELHFTDLSDPYRAFDIAKVIETCQTSDVAKSARILDLGAYGDPVPLALHTLGYEEVCGIDLNPGVFNMPSYTSIHYHVADALATHYPESFFDVCLAPSLTEHPSARLDDFLGEASRVLDDKGLLLLTTNLSLKPGRTKREDRGFDGRRLFAARDIQMLVRSAEDHGLSLITELPKNLDADHPPTLEGREYTEVFLAFRLGKHVRHREARVAVLCPSLAIPRDGISEYAKTLAGRLHAELCGEETEIPDGVDTVLVETYTTQFSRVKQFHFDTRRRWYVDCHGLDSDMISWFNENRDVTPIVRSSYLVMLEQEEIPKRALNRYLRHLPPVASPVVPPFRWVASKLIKARSPKLRSYTVAPHILYTAPRERQKRSSGELCLGSFGFAFRFKGFDRIIDLGRKLGVSVVILASISDSTPDVHRETSKVAEQLEKQRSGKITVLTGFFDRQEILAELSRCSHILMAQKDMREASGTIRFVHQLGLPIVALDSLQARDAGCLRVSSLDEITIPYLESTRNVSLNIEDGLPYYRAILSA